MAIGSADGMSLFTRANIQTRVNDLFRQGRVDNIDLSLWNTFTQSQQIYADSRTISALGHQDDCPTVEVLFMDNDCSAITTGAAVTTCTITGGDEAKVFSDTKTLDEGFTINGFDLLNGQCPLPMTEEEFLAHEIARRMRTVKLELLDRLNVFLAANNTNVTTDGSGAVPIGEKGAVNTDVWEIDEVDFTLANIPHISKFINANYDMNNPLMLDSGILYVAKAQAEAKNSGNCCESAKLLEYFNYGSSIKGFTATNQNKMFVMGSNALAYVNHAYGMDQPVRVDGSSDIWKARFAVPDMYWYNNGTRQNIYLDLYWEKTCTNRGKSTTVKYDFEHTGGFILNDGGCGSQILEIDMIPTP